MAKKADTNGHAAEYLFLLNLMDILKEFKQPFEVIKDKQYELNRSKYHSSPYCNSKALYKVRGQIKYILSSHHQMGDGTLILKFNDSNAAKSDKDIRDIVVIYKDDEGNLKDNFGFSIKTTHQELKGLRCKTMEDGRYILPWGTELEKYISSN